MKSTGKKLKNWRFRKIKKTKDNNLKKMRYIFDTPNLPESGIIREKKGQKLLNYCELNTQIDYIIPSKEGFII